jgi:hypothetical protein
MLSLEKKLSKTSRVKKVCKNTLIGISLGLPFVFNSCATTDREAASLLLGAVAPYGKDARAAAAVARTADTLARIEAAERSRSQQKVYVIPRAQEQQTRTSQRAPQQQRREWWQTQEWLMTAGEYNSVPGHNFHISWVGDRRNHFYSDETFYIIFSLHGEKGNQVNYVLTKGNQIEQIGPSKSVGGNAVVLGWVYDTDNNWSEGNYKLGLNVGGKERMSTYIRISER